MNPPSGSKPDLICLSHLRWNFVFQRPQHLMTRCARERRVYFIEEPIYETAIAPRLDMTADAVTVVVPRLPEGITPESAVSLQRMLIEDFLRREHVDEFIAWYYTPLALAFTDRLAPLATVYDCMDELSAFKGAPAALLKEREAQLLRRADLVLTGGQSLYEAKRHQHENIHPFPSSVDVAHFAQARKAIVDPVDQKEVPRPRLGFFGVIDERMDLDLIDGVAAARPDWHIIMLGPVVKIDPATLPQRPNVHYLGGKQYSELPRYVAAWDVALMPFARNDATRFISPTKTPEYMAAGLPVVSTSIRDVVRPYGQRGLVRIADDVSSFVSACSEAMAEDRDARLARADSFLKQMSWDSTWRRIQRLVDAVTPTGTGNADSLLPRDSAAV